MPVRKRVLDPKVREFIFIAADAAATHLYAPGIRQHIRAALDVGATAAEIMEVLELTSTLGIHACNIGIPLLIEVLEEEGLRTGPAELTPRQEELKAEFTANRGYWHEFWDGLLELDPELFAAYVEFSSVPWRNGVLEPKVKEFVYIAFDAAATHLYVPGLQAAHAERRTAGSVRGGDRRGARDRQRDRYPRRHGGGADPGGGTGAVRRGLTRGPTPTGHVTGWGATTPMSVRTSMITGRPASIARSNAGASSAGLSTVRPSAPISSAIVANRTSR